MPSSGSAGQISRKFNFYYWSADSEECYSADRFLSDNAIPCPTKTDHAASPIRGRAAVQIARNSRKLIIIHGRETSKLAITAEIPDQVLAGLLLDRDGYLRVPCVRVGGAVVVGFSEAVYRSSLFFGNASPTASKKQTRMQRLTRGAGSSLMAPLKAIGKTFQGGAGEEAHEAEENHGNGARTPKRQRVTSKVVTSPAAAWAVGVASPPLSPH